VDKESNSYCKWRQLMMATKHKNHLTSFTATQQAMAKSNWPQQQDQQQQQGKNAVSLSKGVCSPTTPATSTSTSTSTV